MLNNLQNPRLGLAPGRCWCLNVVLDKRLLVLENLGKTRHQVGIGGLDEALAAHNLAYEEAEGEKNERPVRKYAIKSKGDKSAHSS